MWDMIQRIAELPVAAGATYDAFMIEILTAAGVQAIATGNAKEFGRLSRLVRIIDPRDRGD